MIIPRGGADLIKLVVEKFSSSSNRNRGRKLPCLCGWSADWEMAEKNSY